MYPRLQALFHITPLNWVEWKAVLYLSAPVLAIDEVLKFVSVRWFLDRRFALYLY